MAAQVVRAIRRTFMNIVEHDRWLRECRKQGLQPSDFGQLFTFSGNTYRICGIANREIKVIDIRGRGRKLPAAVVLRCLVNEAAPDLGRMNALSMRSS